MVRGCAGGILLVLLSASAFADSAAPALPDATTTSGDSVVVPEVESVNLEQLLKIKIKSATKVEQRIETAPSVISVYTKEQIRALGFRKLSESLRLIAGATVLESQFGEHQVAIRGISNPANVLLALDGERLNDFYDGTFFSDLILENIERMEIIRGPGSALYGTNAFSGVISLYSRPANDMMEVSGGPELRFDNSMGAGGQLQLKISRTIGNWNLRTFATYYETTGPKVLVEKDNTDPTNARESWRRVPGETVSPQRQAFVNAAIERKGLITNQDTLELWLTFLYQRRGPYFGPNRVKVDSGRLISSAFIGYLEYNVPLKHDFHLKARYSFDRRDRDNNVQSFPDGWLNELHGNFIVEPGELFPEGKRDKFHFTTYRTGFKVELSHDVTKNKRIRSNNAIIGLEGEYIWMPTYDYSSNYGGSVGMEEYRGPSFSNYRNVPLDQRGRDRWVIAAFLQDQLQPIKGLWLTGGLRLDYYSDFGFTVNPRVAVVWKPKRYISSKLLYGRAFRAPTFQELYDNTLTRFNKPGQPIRNNNALQPETTDTFEAEIEAAPFFWSALRASVFYIRTNNVIDAESTFNVAGPQLINYPGRQIWGIEGELQLYLNRENYFFANVSWFDSTQLGDGLPGFETQSDRRFVNKSMTDIPSLRFNAAIRTVPFYKLKTAVISRLQLGFNYSYVGSSKNNSRTAFEGLSLFERPAYHELGASLSLPLYYEQLELVASYMHAFNKTIPVSLSTGWYEMPAPASYMFVGLRIHN